jgi:hypothetical protein
VNQTVTRGGNTSIKSYLEVCICVIDAVHGMAPMGPRNTLGTDDHLADRTEKLQNFPVFGAEYRSRVFSQPSRRRLQNKDESYIGICISVRKHIITVHIIITVKIHILK